VSTTKLGNAKSDEMTIDELVSFFDINLVFCFITKLQRAFKCSLRFRLDDIITMISLVNQYANSFA
jgi:hypothetical protein